MTNSLHGGSLLRGRGVFLVAALSLVGCAVGPDFVRPGPSATDRYSTEKAIVDTIAAAGTAQHFTPGAAVPADWWKLFGSPTLDAAVQQALSKSPTLEAAQASLRQSQDNLRAGDGLFYPELDASFVAERAHSAASQRSGTATGSVFDVVTLSGTVGYTIDVFGGERRTVEGLQAQVDNQRYLFKAAFLALTGNVAETFIARSAYRAQLQATRELIALEREQLQAIEAQVRAGTSPYANVLSQRSLIAANEASLAPLQQKASQAAHLLALLQGVAPSDASSPDVELGSLTLPTNLPLSLPSELVRQRPDILSAEAQLHVASANIGVATAALFPSFTLDATFGNASSGARNLLGAGTGFWSLAPSILAPIFHGGSLRAQRQAAVDAYDVQRADYRQTVLAALVQVADTLKALEFDAQALHAQDEARSAASEALGLLQANYHAGLVAYVDVLAADVQYHQAVIGDLQAVALRQQDTVALFVALGGGWWSAPSFGGVASAP